MTLEADNDAAEHVHHAITDYLDADEIAIHWCVTIEVAGPHGTRYIAHRAGGGHDGTDAPTAWTALGMLRASVLVAEDQLRDMTIDTDDD